MTAPKKKAAVKSVPKLGEALGKVVSAIEQLSSDDQNKVLSAAACLLGFDIEINRSDYS